MGSDRKSVCKLFMIGAGIKNINRRPYDLGRRIYNIYNEKKDKV